MRHTSLALALATGFVAPAHAETLPEFVGETIVVTPSRFPQALSGQTANTTVITRQQIEHVTQAIDDLVGKIVVSDVADPGTGEVLAECGQQISEELLGKLRERNVQPVSLFTLENSDRAIWEGLVTDRIRTREEALKEIYKKMRGQDFIVKEQAEEYLDNIMFKSLRRYDFSVVAADEAELNTKSVFGRGEYNISADWTAYFTTQVNRAESFGRYAPELVATDYGGEIWALFEAGTLRPDSALTGRFERVDAAVDLASVLQEIEDARLEDAARRSRLQDVT